jgi:hypothetical protein
VSNEAAGTNVDRASDFHSLAIVSLYEMESSGDRPEGGRIFLPGSSAMNAEHLNDFGYDRSEPLHDARVY